MLLLRAHVLALGHSGVRVELVERMVEMLNRDLVPVVPEQGSLGASGDLAPLANLALPLLGRGELLAGGERVPAAEALGRAGLEPLHLRAKARAGERHAGMARSARSRRTGWLASSGPRTSWRP
jgi:histidine ammonia-lyase